MSNDDHHRGALIETARSELDRAHRGVLAMDASEVRRGVQIALSAIDDALSHGAVEGTDGETHASLADASTKLTRALADLDHGALAEMGTLIEVVRSTLA